MSSMVNGNRQKIYDAIVRQVTKVLKNGQYYTREDILIIPYLYLPVGVLREINSLDKATCGKTESQYLKMRALEEEKVFIQNLGYPPKLTHDELEWQGIKQKILKRIDRPYTAGALAELNKEVGPG